MLPGLFFWRHTLGWGTLGDQDAVFWFFPAYKFVAEQLRSGHLPLWSPFLYSGSPIYAQWQAGALDPINWIYLIGTTARTLTLAQELSFAISLVSTFLYTRSLGLRRRAAVVSAVIYSLSGFQVGRTLYPGFIHIVALLPLVLFFTERLYRRGRRQDLIGGALVIAWQVFAAHPQPLIYSSLLVCAYALSCVLFRSDEAEKYAGRKGKIRFLLEFSLMFIAGMGFSAIQLLPAAEIAVRSVRQEWPYELFTLHSLHPISLLNSLFPFLHGGGAGIYKLPYWGVYWHHNEAQIYLGLIAISLAVAGSIHARRSRFIPGNFWSFAALIGILLALGKYTGPLSQLLFRVPLLSHFRSPNRHWMEVALAVAVLAGYAMDRLLSEESPRLKSNVRNSAIVLALLSLAAGGFVLLDKERAERIIRSMPDLDRINPGFLQQAGAEFYLPMLSAMAALLILWWFAASRYRARLYPLLLLFLLADYNLYEVFAPVSNPFKLEDLVGKAMPETLAARQSETDPIRYHILLNPQTGEFSPFWFYGHEMASGYDPMLNERYKTFSGIDEAGRSYLTTMLEPFDRTLDLLNVRYVFVPPSFVGQGHSKNPDQDSNLFAAELNSGRAAVYKLDGSAGDAVRLVSNLSNSPTVPDNAGVAELIIKCGNETAWSASILTGRDTAEWAYDRADVKKIIRHSRPPIAESGPGDPGSTFQAHSYRASFKLPAGGIKCSSSRTIEIRSKPEFDVTLSVKSIAIEDSATGKITPLPRSLGSALDESARWRLLPDRSTAEPYKDYLIYENLNSLPRAWLVNQAKIEYEGDQLKLIRGQLNGFNPLVSALVDHDTAGKLDKSLLAEKGPAFRGKSQITRRTPTNMLARIESDSASILVLSEVFVPGWKVEIDGQSSELIQVDYNLRGVQLPAGNHQVRIFYDPLSIKIGAAISILTALFLVVFMLGKRKDYETDGINETDEKSLKG